MPSQTVGLSIVVSSYNYARYLRATIDSALIQPCDPLQVIVVDDGSTDESIEIIKSYGDRIEPLLQENQGQMASCTAGVQLCRHDVVILLDSDDYLEPFAATEIMRLWTDKTVKVQYALQAIDSDGEPVNTIFPKYPHSLTPETIRAEQFRSGVYPAATTSGTAFSREFLKEVMPLPKGYACDIDDALNALSPLYGDVQTLRKPLGYYRVHDSNTSAHADLTAARFERYASDSAERTRLFRDWCKKLGIAVRDDLEQNDLAYMECRLAAAVMKPSARLPLLIPTLRAAFGSILDPGQRITHAIWATGLALAPRPLARKLLAQRFIFNQRSRLVEFILSSVWRFGHLYRRLFAGSQKSNASTAPADPIPLAAKGNDDARI